MLYSYNTSQNQFVFKNNLSIELRIHVLKQVNTVYVSKETPVFVYFMDMSKAFDRVNQDKLFNIITEAFQITFYLSL